MTACLPSIPRSNSVYTSCPTASTPHSSTKRSPPGAHEGPRTLIHAGASTGIERPSRCLPRWPTPVARARAAGTSRRDRSANASRLLTSTAVEVRVEPTVSAEQAIERVLEADIAVVINAPGTGGDMALPSKLFEALALGRPVLALTGASQRHRAASGAAGQDPGSHRRTILPRSRPRSSGCSPTRRLPLRPRRCRTSTEIGSPRATRRCWTRWRCARAPKRLRDDHLTPIGRGEECGRPARAPASLGILSSASNAPRPPRRYRR